MMCVDRKLIRERGCLHHRYLRYQAKAMLPDATKTQIYMNIYQQPNPDRSKFVRFLLIQPKHGHSEEKHT